MYVAHYLLRDLKIFTSTLTGIALALTAYNVIHRYVTRTVWWEDACAVVALVGGIIYVVTSWTYFELAGQPSLISFWIYSLTYPTVVWSVRLSVLLSILHIMSTLGKLRRLIILLATLFVLMWFSLVLLLVGRYTSGRSWNASSSQGGTEAVPAVAIYQLITDIVSDCILIGLPICSLRSVKLPYFQRRMIIAVFSPSILVTIVCIFRTVCQTFVTSNLVDVAIDAEVACSLCVCNALFITTLVYRMLHRNDGTAGANTGFPGRTPKDTLQFSTVLPDVFSTVNTGRFSAGGPATAPASADSEKDIVP